MAKNVSFYLDDRTLKLWESLPRKEGSSLFRRFLELHEQTRVSSLSLATVQASPFPHDIENSPYHFEKWIDPEDTSVVFLIGTTLYGAFYDDRGNKRKLWDDLVSQGVSLNVLLQGRLDDPIYGQAISEIKGEQIKDILEKSKATTEFLTELGRGVEHVEVRYSNKPITQSLFLVYDKGSQYNFDVQMRSYPSLSNTNGTPGMGLRTNFRIDEHNQKGNAVWNALLYAWDNATKLDLG